MTYSNLSRSDFLWLCRALRRQVTGEATPGAREGARLLKCAVVWFAVFGKGGAQREGHLVGSLEREDVDVDVKRALCVCVLSPASETGHWWRQAESSSDVSARGGRRAQRRLGAVQRGRVGVGAAVPLSKRFPSGSTSVTCSMSSNRMGFAAIGSGLGTGSRDEEKSATVDAVRPTHRPRKRSPNAGQKRDRAHRPAQPGRRGRAWAAYACGACKSPGAGGQLRGCGRPCSPRLGDYSPGLPLASQSSGMGSPPAAFGGCVSRLFTVPVTPRSDAASACRQSSTHRAGCPSTASSLEPWSSKVASLSSLGTVSLPADRPAISPADGGVERLTHAGIHDIAAVAWRPNSKDSLAVAHSGGVCIWSNDALGTGPGQRGGAALLL